MTRMTRSLVVLRITLAVLLGTPTLSRAQIVPEPTPVPMWGVNGEVRALARVGRTLYVGGNFDVVGPPSGGMAAVSAADPSAVTPSTGVGTASTLVSDGAGGWYTAEWGRFIGTGYFVAVRHVRSDGTLDPAFSPALFESSSSIYSLAVAGGRVYVTGTLGTVNGVQRFGPVALDAVTGAALPWTLTTRTGEMVYGASFSAAAGGRVYFPVLQGAAPDILAIDGATGAILPFQIQSPPAVASISQMAATSSHLFAIGTGCGPAGSPPGLCAFDAQTGALVWTWSNAYIASVWTSGDRVYVASRDPYTLHALDAATGVPTGWVVTDAGVVFDVAAADGRVYVVTSRDGNSRMRAYAFDAATAMAVAWDPVVENVLSVDTHQGRVALGGSFRTAGGIRRRHLVALDLDTGRPAAVQPAEPFGAVNALATYGDIVFVGMESGAPEVFAFAASSGQRYLWGLVPNGKPLSLLVAGQTLYIGGFFSQLSGEDRGFLGAVDLTTGALRAWDPALTFQVSELSATATRLYAAGRTTGPYGSTVGNAAFDLATQQRLPFDAGLQFVSGARYFATTRDRLLMTSRFYYPPRGFGVAWLDPDTGAVRSEVQMPFWTQFAGGHGDTVVVGGFDETTSLPRLGALDARSGAPMAWAPFITDPSGVPGGGYFTAILVQSDFVATGGTMSNVEGRQVANLAVFRATASAPPAPRAVAASVSGFAATVSWLADGSAETFVVEAGSSSGATNVGVFPVGAATTASGTLGAGRYFVRVKGVGESGTSPASSEVILDVPSTSTAPDAPAGLSATVTAGVVTLRWRAAGGNAASYVIEAGSAPGLANLAVLPTGHLDTTFVTPAPSGTYFVRVRATNAFGASAGSNEITVTVP